MYAKTITIKSPKGFARLGGLFLIVGIIMLVVSAVAYVHEASFVKSALITNGTVIDVVDTLDDNGASLTNAATNNMGADSSYRPVVQFEVGGKKYVFTSNTGSNPPSYSEGDVVQVVYNPENPADASIHSWFSQWGFVAIALLIGVGFSLIGSFMLRFRKRIAEQNQTDDMDDSNF